MLQFVVCYLIFTFTGGAVQLMNKIFIHAVKELFIQEYSDRNI